MAVTEHQQGDRDADFVGAALLSNTTVCEPSRLLLAGEASAGEQVAAMRISDLLSLVDAAVLYERIYFLPASLPADTEQLRLRSELLGHGVLELFPLATDHELVAQALLATLGTETYTDFEGEPLQFDTLRDELAAGLGLPRSDRAGASEPIVEGHDEALYFGAAAGAGAHTFSEAAGAVIEGVAYGASGAYEHATSGLRAMYYVYAAEHHQLPYIPSASARPIERNFPNYFDRSTRQQIYEQLATALRTTAAKVARAGENTVFVPPFAAIVLDRATTPGRIPEETLALRDEYSELRAKLGELEHERAQARSIDERIRANAQIERLCEEVTRPFEQPAELKLEASLRYIPDAVELASNPTNPVNWAKLLLDKPAEALISWHRRRPVAKLVQAARDVKAMPDYMRLLSKHFGAEIASRATEYQTRLP